MLSLKEQHYYHGLTPVAASAPTLVSLRGLLLYARSPSLLEWGRPRTCLKQDPMMARGFFNASRVNVKNLPNEH